MKRAIFMGCHFTDRDAAVIGILDAIRILNGGISGLEAFEQIMKALKACGVDESKGRLDDAFAAAKEKGLIYGPELAERIEYIDSYLRVYWGVQSPISSDMEGLIRRLQGQLRIQSKTIEMLRPVIVPPSEARVDSIVFFETP